jgi:cytochrome c oxidase subunit 3
MAGHKNHDYHILAPSIWPLVGAIGALLMLFGAVLLVHGHGPWLALIGFVAVLYTMYSWWSDVVGESRAGDHTPVVQLGLRYGVLLFIISEVMFFSAWFWSFFKHAMYPMPAIDSTWPPPGIETFDPWHLPLVNTLVLLCSGCAATWAHHEIVHENNRQHFKWGLWLAICLGLLFTCFQAFEYFHAEFGFAGNIYGANFFMATGFHGFRVIIGTIFLAV